LEGIGSLLSGGSCWKTYVWAIYCPVSEFLTAEILGLLHVFVSYDFWVSKRECLSETVHMHLSRDYQIYAYAYSIWPPKLRLTSPPM